MKAKKIQKRVSIQEYIETYCQEKRIRERYAVYISPQTHENLKKIVRLFCYEHHTTTSSLADTIISRHIETYRDILNEEHKEYMSKLFNWGNKSDPEGKDPESLQDDDSGE